MTSIERLFWVSCAISLHSGCIATINTATEPNPEPVAACADHSNPACRYGDLIAACTATVDRYVYARDRLLFADYGALFTEDAVFEIDGGPVVTGRAQIVAALKARGPMANLRHDSRLVHMQPTGESTAQGVSYFTIWRGDDGGARLGKNMIGSPWVFGEYHDEYRLHANQCLISQRVIKIVFQASGPEI